MTAGSFRAALARAGVTDAALTAEARTALDVDGYVLLRGVFDDAQCAGLRDVFERTYLPSDEWPAPRGAGTRHARLDNEPEAWRACFAPRLLACAQHLLQTRFFLFDVQGRDPRHGHGEQRLHRDWVTPQGPAPMAIGLAFLDSFDAANGATRVVPGTHRLADGPEPYASVEVYPNEVVVEGAAGDVLMCDGYLVHSGRRNVSGAPRRNLQIAYEVFDAGRVPKRDTAGASPETRYLLGAEA